MPMSTYCATCKHYNKDLTCKAFPDGVPEKIITGLQEHNEPIAGQVGDFIHEPIEGGLT